MSFTPEEMSKLKTYLEKKFKCSGIAVKKREKAEDSIEVMVDGEFVALIYKVTEEGETSYDLNMCILDIDLDEAA